ncbi:GLE1-like protein-domain-containing protein [Halteromyces radiatus]|uniref:GLE1-like protein-domain-containing protein n=1 Tax=Halteromyces radiatus TaxID=101107 RepID=UPI00221ECE59|nr:GLE1-like protein-domain-containing protein [Halteromyces radiatus]KAI8093297.1 GLE1-like protein-domain-containing protein [Halteromyces radiatus]
MDKLQKLISSMKVSLANHEKELDQRFNDDTAKHKKLVEDAIAFDVRKYEEEMKQKKAKEEDEKNKKQLLEAKKKAQAEKKAQLELEQKKLSSNKGGASSTGLEEYNKHMAAIENYKKNIKPKLEDPAFRKQCFEARRLIKRTIIQLQFKHNVILEKYQILRDHILNVKNQSIDAFHVLLNHVGKTLLLQVRQEVDGAPFSAYFLAKLAVLLAGSIPEFKDYLYGRLLKRCPYLVPNYFDYDSTLSHDEIKKLLHYQYDEDKKEFQSFLQYAPKQRCYVMFFAAMITTVPGAGHPANPFSIGLGWTWCARIMNMSQREITPTLIHAFLEIAGNRMVQAYPRQFPKVLRLLYDQVIPTTPIHPNKDNVSAISVLKMYLEDYFNTGNMVPIPEIMKANV